MLTFSLTLVRHGETQYNRDKRLQGQGVDTPLSETGVQQGEAAGRYLQDVAFTNVFSSNLQRAVQTAEIILRNNAHCSGVEMLLEPLLREQSFGVAEGHPKEHLKNMANAAGQSCRDYTPPGGETLGQVKLRFKKFLQVLFKQILSEQGPSGSGSSAGASGDGLSVSASAAAAAASSAAAAASAASPEVASVGPADEGLEGLTVHALVVCHGAYIRAAVRHLLEDLQCSAPPGMKTSQLMSPCPNTGISRFLFTLSQTQTQTQSGPVLSSTRCVFTNRKHHLEKVIDESDETH